jgi:hypothetical protein
MRLLVAALVGVSGLASPAVAGPCAIAPLVPSVLAVNGTLVPPDGGVLVGLLDLNGWDQPSQPDLAKTKWRFVDGTKEVEPVIRMLAPGLAVYAHNTATKLIDAKRTLVTVRRVDAKPLLPAPSVKSIVYVRNTPPPSPRSFHSTQVTASLTGPRPDGAVAMIVFTSGKVPTPMSWVSAFSYEGPTGELEIYRTPGRCHTQIPGFSETPPGSRVTLAWVDASGRVGLSSKEVVVAKGRSRP